MHPCQFVDDITFKVAKCVIVISSAIERSPHNGDLVSSYPEGGGPGPVKPRQPISGRLILESNVVSPKSPHHR
jgi:hypothetical protein